MVTQTILLHTWVEIDLNSIGVIFFKSKFLDRAREGLIDFKIDCCRQWPHILNGELLGLGGSCYSLFPHVLKVELWHIELQNRSDEVTKHIRVENGFGFAVVANHSLTLPGLLHLAGLGRVCSEFDHDTHLRVKHHCVRNHSEDKLGLFLLFLFAFRGSHTTCSSLVSFFLSGFRFLLIRFLGGLDLSDPGDTHGLAATVLKEELLCDDFVGVLCSKINVTKILFAEKSRAGTFSLKINFKVDTVIDNDMKFVLELLNFISVAHNINNFFFVRLQDTVSLDNFPDGFFVLGKSSELGVNL